MFLNVKYLNKVIYRHIYTQVLSLSMSKYIVFKIKKYVFNLKLHALTIRMFIPFLRYIEINLKVGHVSMLFCVVLDITRE